MLTARPPAMAARLIRVVHFPQRSSIDLFVGSSLRGMLHLPTQEEDTGVVGDVFLNRERATMTTLPGSRSRITRRSPSNPGRDRKPCGRSFSPTRSPFAHV